MAPEPTIPNAPTLRAVPATTARCLRVAGSCLLIVLASRTAGAVELDAIPAGITVSGQGEVMARPNRAEIQVTTQGTAELTSDALVKYKGARKRVLEAYKSLKLANVTIEDQGIAIITSIANQPQVFWNGMAQNQKAQVQITGTLKVILKGIQNMSEDQVAKTMGTLLDTAKDSGGKIGPSAAEAMNAWRYGMNLNGNLVTFVVDDIKAVREKAFKKASEDARTNAERLAGLSGVKLGPVLAVQEGPPPQHQPTPYYNPYMAAANNAADPNRVTSTTLKESPVRIHLTVRFGIEKQAGS